MDIVFPPEYQTLFDTLAPASRAERDIWRYALVLLMIDLYKMKIEATHLDGDTLHLVVRSTTGELFSVVRPNISEEVEQAILEQIRDAAESTIGIQVQ